MSDFFYRVHGTPEPWETEHIEQRRQEWEAKQAEETAKNAAVDDAARYRSALVSIGVATSIPLRSADPPGVYTPAAWREVVEHVHAVVRSALGLRGAEEMLHAKLDAIPYIAELRSRTEELETENIDLKRLLEEAERKLHHLEGRHTWM